MRKGTRILVVVLVGIVCSFALLFLDLMLIRAQYGYLGNIVAAVLPTAVLIASIVRFIRREDVASLAFGITFFATTVLTIVVFLVMVLLALSQLQ